MLQGGTTTNLYDVNNNLVAVSDATKPANNRSLVNDVAGRILQSTQNGNTQRQLVANGEVLGRYGTYLNADKPADSSGNPLFTTGANFNFGYTKISGSYPGANPGTRTVAAGETLQSIAKSIYGDSSLWYLVADANGLSSDRDLRVGQTLTLPNRVSGANNSSSFKPYNPGDVVGNTTPNLPSPPSGGGGGGGCGGLGSIIMVVVAVAVTVYTGGAGGAIANFWAGAGLTGTAATVATAATAAALGSIASQAVGNVLGIQSGFDWNGVAMAAIGGGVTAGIGGVNMTGGAATSMGNTIARAALSNAMTQGIAVVTGMQKEFNWTSVAASAVGAGVGHGMNRALGLTDAAGKATTTYNGMDKISRAAFSSFASGTAATLARGGKVEVTQIATDVFGNALGSSIAGELERGGEQERRAGTYQRPMVDPDTGDHIVMGALLPRPAMPSLEWITADLKDGDANSRLTTTTLELRAVGGKIPDPMDGAVLLADASKYTGNKVVSDAGGGYGDFGLGLPQDDAIGVLASKNLGGAGTGASVGGQGLSFEDDVAARKAASDPFGLKAASVPASDAPTRYPGFMESPEPWPEPAPPLSDEAARANNPNYSNEGRNAPRPEAIGIELQSPSTNTPNDTSIVNGRAYKEHFGAVKNPSDLEDMPVILNKKGSAQCAELVKVTADAPRTGNDGWYKGTAMTPDSVGRI